MAHNNIAVFIPHMGCPHTCSFCNQRTISGEQAAPNAKTVDLLLSDAISRIANKQDTEIAFFGGSFTAIDRQYMLSLLQTAQKYIGKNKFAGIRISTRPDAIDEEILGILKEYGVTSIELGAQSMRDDVLFANERGHTAQDVRKAAGLIKSYGFELGLQMMISLYGDDIAGAEYTAEEFIKIKPDVVRIYPTVILKGTRLAELYKSGCYKVIDFNDAVRLCARLMLRFEENGIRVIKLGLHSSVDVEKDFVGGIYHPAFKELCEGEIYLDKALSALKNIPQGKATIFVAPSAVSKMIGQSKCNIKKLYEKGYTVLVKPDSKLYGYEMKIETDVKTCF